MFAVLRSQQTNRTAAQYADYSDNIVAAAVDIAGHFATPIPGNPSTYLYGAGEVAFILGSTNELRSADQALTGQLTAIQSYGGAASIGVVHEARRAGDAAPSGQVPVSSSPLASADDPRTWGDIAVQLEVGYASGDANPYDTTEHRFTFDPNHKVGLVLFDEVMRWQTARASAAAQDPLLQNGTRPTPGVNLLPSHGGVFGAEYLYPTIIVRPKPWVDFESGRGHRADDGRSRRPVSRRDARRVRELPRRRWASPRSRHRARRRLRVPLRLDRGLTVQLGAQAGVLFPGGAFADASGSIMNAPCIVVGRGGLQF